MRASRIVPVLLACATGALAQSQPPERPHPNPSPTSAPPGERKPSGGDVGATTPPSSAAAAPQRMKSFDMDAMDRAAQPCQDFYQFACGGFQAKNPIPPDQARWGRFELLREYNRALLRQILDAAAAKKTHADANEQKIADYYATCMDDARANAKGLAPARPYLRRIDAMKSTRELAKVVADLHHEGVDGLFTWDPRPMLHDAAMMASWADQGGMALGNKDFYTKTDEKSVRIREQY